MPSIRAPGLGGPADSPSSPNQRAYDRAGGRRLSSTSVAGQGSCFVAEKNLEPEPGAEAEGFWRDHLDAAVERAAQCRRSRAPELREMLRICWKRRNLTYENAIELSHGDENTFPAITLQDLSPHRAQPGKTKPHLRANLVGEKWRRQVHHHPPAEWGLCGPTAADAPVLGGGFRRRRSFSP